MKSCYVLFVLTFLSCHLFSQGLIFDSAEYNKTPELPVVRGVLNESYSLEKYLPILYNQSGSTCVAMSFALARTIMYAEENNIINKDSITVYSMSPYFLYYLARDKHDISCAKGLDPIAVANIAKKVGFEFLFSVEYPKYYPFQNATLCPNQMSFFPPVLSQHITNASKNKINEVYIANNIENIKYAISHDLPLILCLHIPKSFEQLKSKIWTPLPNETKQNAVGGHAVVAVGYDDNLSGGCVLIANSWGENWGNQGTAWIKYTDLKIWLDGALTMEPSYTYKAEIPKIAQTESKNLIRQTFVLKQFNENVEFDNQNIIDAFKNVTIPKHF